MAGSIQGKFISIKVGDKFLRCNTTASLTITKATNEEDACKPSDGSTTGVVWSDPTVGVTSWTMSATNRAFADDDVLVTEIDNDGLTELLLTSDGIVEVAFQTLSAATTKAGATWVYAGTAIINSFSIEAPSEGSATNTIEFTGKGPLTYTQVPVTPPSE